MKNKKSIAYIFATTAITLKPERQENEDEQGFIE